MWSEIPKRLSLDYDRSKFRGDLVAGLTVGVMVVPQSMAYALIAGMPPIYGLYASLVPLLIYPILASSRHLASGPVALDMFIVAAGVGALADPGSDRFIELAILLAALTGVVELLMGAFRMGFLKDFISRPVITGFLTAAALLILGSQLGGIFGFDIDTTQAFYHVFWEALTKLPDLHWLTTAMGLGGVAMFVGMKFLKRNLPGPLIVVGLGMALSALFGLEEAGVEMVGHVPEGLPTPQLQLLEIDAIIDLVPVALTLAFVDFMSLMSIGQVFARKHGYRIDPNRELLAVGSANIVGSFFRSMVVSGSLSRSAVNESAGARTSFANVVAAVVVALGLLILPPLFAYLPIPVLASIIVVASTGLIRFKEIRYMLKTKRSDGYVAIVTFVSTLFIGIQEGILIGIGGALLVVLHRVSRPEVTVLGHVPETERFRDAEHPEARQVKGFQVMRIEESLTFANAEHLREQILEIVSDARSSVRAIIVDFSGVHDVDLTAVDMLSDVLDDLDERGIPIYFVAAKGNIRDLMMRSSLAPRLREEHLAMIPHDLVDSLLHEWGEDVRYHTGKYETVD